MRVFSRTVIATAMAAAVFAAAPRAQPVFRGSDIFPPDEFAARRAKLLDKIGDAVAIVRGTPGPPGEMPFRQNSQFFYLTGVAEPRADVIIDGRTKRTTIYLQPKDERRDTSMFGPALAPGDEAAKFVGVDAAVPAPEFGRAIAALASDRRTIYTPFAAEVLGSQSQGDPTRFWSTNSKDPWDGRDSREAAFLAKLKAAAPLSKIENLDPLLNALRAVKSPREIAVIREATRIAGLGIMEAMRDATPGMHEYELQADAEFVFKKFGALGPSYFALIATGPNTYYTHYNRNTAVLKDGDFVQFDYAPDYKYYQSDVTRVFPANGRFTARQREFYEIYLRLYQALMTSIEVHKRPVDVIAAAVRKMDAIMASYPFTDARIKEAAQTFVEGFRSRKQASSLGHNVGLEVHDPGGLQAETLEPGRVFTIEPQMRIEEEHLGLRLEDMILITDSGYENLSRFVPIEVKDIEQTMGEHGVDGGTLSGTDRLAPGHEPIRQVAARRDAREQRIQVDRASLYARDIGRGEPLIVLHGGPDFDSAYLLPEFDRLADQFHLVYYDQRGRGKSAAQVNPQDVTLGSDINDIDRVRQHFGFERAVIVGHSWGTLLALEYALKHPERVSQLILLNPAPASSADYRLLRSAYIAALGPDMDRQREMLASDAYRRADPEAVAARYRIHFEHAFARPADYETIMARMRKAFLAQGSDGILEARAVEARLDAETWDRDDYDLLQRVRSLKIPTLVVTGDHDFIPADIAQHIAKAVPNARLVTLHDCGHFSYLECGDDVHRAISDFAAKR